MEKCKRCGCRIEELSEEDIQEFGIIDNEGLCSDCWEEEHEFENTCPKHKCYCPDGFCEQCLIKSEEVSAIPPKVKTLGILAHVL
jgi:hypothetical protein